MVVIPFPYLQEDYTPDRHKLSTPFSHFFEKTFVRTTYADPSESCTTAAVQLKEAQVRRGSQRLPFFL